MPPALEPLDSEEHIILPFLPYSRLDFCLFSITSPLPNFIHFDTLVDISFAVVSSILFICVGFSFSLWFVLFKIKFLYYSFSGVLGGSRNKPMLNPSSLCFSNIICLKNTELVVDCILCSCLDRRFFTDEHEHERQALVTF